ncbi:MAG TPA: type II CAAX endopeptidase family protein [Caldilineaceae bacterium]|nr:type II CAAX endopeptidase family protein [Caldilineaceae bacterium]
MNPFDEPLELVGAPDEPKKGLPWGWAELIKAALLIVLGVVLLGIGTVVIARLLRVDPESVAGMSSPLLFGMGVGIYLVVVLAVYLFAVRRPNSSWQLVGVRAFDPRWWWGIIIIFPLQMMGMALINTLLVPLVTGAEFENPQVDAITGGLSMDVGDLLLLLLLIAVIAPIAEELFFRGMVYPVMREHWRPTWAIILNAALFSLVHFIPILLPGLFLVGLILAWVRERSGSLIPGILLHMAQNGLVVLALFAFMGMQGQ